MSAPVRVACDRCDAAVVVSGDYIATTELAAEVVDGTVYLRCSAWPRAWHYAAGPAA